VKSRTLPSFWPLYDQLPLDVRKQARKAFARFESDPFHPSLRFKPLQGYSDYWSVRVTISYRAVCRREGDTAYWFWIGSHSAFDRDFG
jgi:Txe/YoeB family toxin of Txe-Axe toxin-antitoxin module